MHLPRPRGPVSAQLVDALRRPPHADLGALAAAAARALDGSPDLLTDDDLQVALFVLYELHYGGFDDVDDAWEWHPGVLAVRAGLETCCEARLRHIAPIPDIDPTDPQAVAAGVFGLGAADTSPGLSRHLARKATLAQAREFLVLKSIYQLKEADPHTWAIPRLRGPAKAALVEVQADEYGGGDPARAHAHLFAGAMRAAGLDDEFGAYVESIPAIVLAAVNAISLFGLHRRLRGAAVGHLAAFETTSCGPMRRYSQGLARVGLPPEARAYFDEHVAADAVHEQIMVRDVVLPLVAAEPGLLPDVLFGAAACLALEGRVTEHALSAWEGGDSALRDGAA